MSCGQDKTWTKVCKEGLRWFPTTGEKKKIGFPWLQVQQDWKLVVFGQIGYSVTVDSSSGQSQLDARIRPALHTQFSMFFPRQVSACRICSTFTVPAATWDYRKENTIRVRPWCIPLAEVLCFLGDSRKPNGKHWSNQRPQKQEKRTPVLERHASFPEAVSLESTYTGNDKTLIKEENCCWEKDPYHTVYKW